MEQLKRLDLNLFKVFHAIYDERNLTRAAERLSVTQPAVSNALARLRTSLGDPLFVKTSSGMQPTAFSDSAFKHVSMALRSLDSIASQSSGFLPEQSERIFNIVLLDLHDALVLPIVMAQIEKLTPNIRLRVVNVPRVEQRQALASGSLDIASNIPLSDVSDLIVRPLVDEEYVCAFRPDHPALECELTLERYLALKHIQVSGRYLGTSPIDIVLRRKGLQRGVALHLQNYLTAAATVQATNMVLTTTRTWVRNSGLIAVALPVDVPPLQIRLYRHVHTKDDAAVDWIYDQIASATDQVFCSSSLNQQGQAENHEH